MAAATAAGCVAFPAPALVHPHVFAEANLEVAVSAGFQGVAGPATLLEHRLARRSGHGL